MSIAERSIGCQGGGEFSLGHAQTALPDVDPLLLKFRALASVEPELLHLEQDVRKLADLIPIDDPDFWRGYSLWKRRLEQLAGWYCQREILQTSQAYESARDFLMRLYEGSAK